MATFESLITRTITRLSMVPGFGVQTYAEDQIAEMIWHKFIVARDLLWWDDMMVTETLTLDAQGVPTDNIVRTPSTPPVTGEIVINKYSDVQYVWHPALDRPLPAMPRRVSPIAYRYGLFRAPNQSSVLRVFNAKAGEQIIVRYKQYYTFPDAGDDVPFDEQALILGACYDYLEDDGTNPSQIEKFNNLYIQRMDQLAKAENSEEISIGAL